MALKGSSICYAIGGQMLRKQTLRHNLPCKGFTREYYGINTSGKKNQEDGDRECWVTEQSQSGLGQLQWGALKVRWPFRGGMRGLSLYTSTSTSHWIQTDLRKGEKTWAYCQNQFQKWTLDLFIYQTSTYLNRDYWITCHLSPWNPLSFRSLVSFVSTAYSLSNCSECYSCHFYFTQPQAWESETLTERNLAWIIFLKRQLLLWGVTRVLKSLYMASLRGKKTI